MKTRLKTLGEFTCQICGYKWKSRKHRILPVACPKCKRYDWNKEGGKQ